MSMFGYMYTYVQENKTTVKYWNTHYCLGGKEMASASNVAVTLAVIRPSVAV